MVQILGNHPDQNFVQIMPIHHGLPCPTGASILVDYTNYGDEPEQSHIVAVYIDPEDIT